MTAHNPGKIPATVVTGFLGSGKTSTIRHLLEHANGRRIALIINEFGDLGVDGEILKGCGIESCGEDDVVELANGCLCCTVADDFLPTISALLDRALPPDHIVIETSGLALPKPLVKAFGWPEVRTRVTVDGVVALVDGPAVAAGLFAEDPEAVQAQREADGSLDHDSPLAELFEEQIGCADLVVVNKTDLLAPEDLAAVEAAIRQEARPGVRLLHAAHGRLDPDVLLGLSAAAEDDLDSRRSHHEGADDHDHDDFESFAVELPEIAAPAELARRVAALVEAQAVLRVKGFAAVAGRDMRLVLQAAGPRVQHYFDRDWRPDEVRRTRLVVIGLKGLDRAAVEAALMGEAVVAG
ncbi:cobalamin biosynthesis protein CobW [Tistlia consotensis]|uniref:Cobalamin biosynthesis protein CobW n=1 Tax=Tistlia consotensis USBA 355 TaxID=560819 RepID=A0A1Y6BUR0_9PROT|nr:cobalamin biosynthesis protein CobW [Tistlia consotensis]SMF22263.1 cobalamin biosynthesis protein CobW [Tistlia consotensis USBA 355]SNR46140.1 cobalamin biosynthesis protein CobW [Tistlia consotensis]